MRLNGQPAHHCHLLFFCCTVGSHQCYGDILLYIKNTHPRVHKYFGIVYLYQSLTFISQAYGYAAGDSPHSHWH